MAEQQDETMRKFYHKCVECRTQINEPIFHGMSVVFCPGCGRETPVFSTMLINGLCGKCSRPIDDCKC